MTGANVDGLRSVDLGVADLAARVKFYTEVWQLETAARQGNTAYLRGTGNNVFAYFVGPDEVVIEYTAEVEQVDTGYRVRGPEEWAWPAGRTDHWGIAIGPTPRLVAAQQRVGVAPDLLR